MKISWMDWNTVCSGKEVGGLGVRRIREFNVALLGKWCWRLLEDNDSMWFRVLSAMYGAEEGRLLGGGERLPCGGATLPLCVGRSGLKTT